jgi:hypothetical protein
LTVTGAWRLAIGAWGIIAHGVVASGPYASDTLMHRGWPSNPFTLLIDAGVRMDGFWYAGIAQHGYAYSVGKLSSIAYFPLYPLLIKGVSVLTAGNVYVAGMLISTICLFLAVWALQAWLNLRGVGSSSALAVGLMICFPVGFFFVSMYTESLFLALALGAFVCFERERWGAAAACCFLAVLSRPTGLILVPCLAVMAIARDPIITGWIAERGSRLTRTLAALIKPDDAAPLRDRLLPWFSVVAGPVAYACFALYQWITFGNPLATVKADQAPPFSRNLGQGLSDLTLNRPGFPSWYLADLLGLGLLFLAAVPVVYRRFGLPYALFAAMAVLFPMSTGLVSLERYVLIDFPVFAALAMSRSRMIPLALVAVGFYLSLGLMALLIAGYTII